MLPVFSEIYKKYPITHLPTLSTTVTSLQEHTALHRLLYETESYLSSTYNELDTSDIIYSKGYIKAYSPLVKADYKDINTFIVAGFDGKATDDKHPVFCIQD